MSMLFMRRPIGRIHKDSGSIPSVNLPTIPDDEEDESDDLELGGRRTRSSYGSYSADGRLRSASSSLGKLSAAVASRSLKPKTRIGKFYEHLTKVYRKLGLSHMIPVLLLVIYSLSGASILLLIEAPHEQHLETATKVNRELIRNHAVQRLGKILKDKELTMETKLYASRDLIMWYEKKLGYEKSLLLKWDIWGALFYVGTIFTTIGYGNIYARTTGGRIMSVICALVGVPLALAILNDMGNVLSKRINQLWRWLKRKRKKLLRLSTTTIQQGLDEEEEEEIPVCLALSLTIFWMLFCAAIFCLWEKEWNYFTALYFFFISLSTIGFGDITPDRPRMMVLNFGLVMIGLSLVSMTIHVIQRHIELFLYRMAEQIQAEFAQAIEAGHLPDHQTLLAKAWKKQSWLTRHVASNLLGEGHKQRLVQCAQEAASKPSTRCGTLNDLRKAISRHSVAIEVTIPKPMRSSFTQTVQKWADKMCQVGPHLSNTAAQVSVSMEASTVSFHETEMQTSVQVIATHDTGSQSDIDTHAAQTQTETSVDLRETEVQTDYSYIKKAKRLFDLTHLRANNLEIMAVPLNRIRRAE